MVDKCEEITVLSLCDGMSCGQIALSRLGIQVSRYFAAEIKQIAIKVTKYNFPETVHIGDVNKVHYICHILSFIRGVTIWNSSIVLGISVTRN